MIGANIKHIARHDILPSEVEEAYENEPLDLDYDFADGEERWTCPGHTNGLRVPLVVWTMRGDLVRTVTARDADWGVQSAYCRMKGI